MPITSTSLHISSIKPILRIKAFIALTTELRHTYIPLMISKIGMNSRLATNHISIILTRIMVIDIKLPQSF